jgi:hypothetical protein
MRKLGVVEFTTEVLHDTDIFFDFIEENFKVIEIDHRKYETEGIIRMVLQDISNKFYFFTPCCNGELYEYKFEAEISPESTVITVRILD